MKTLIFPVPSRLLLISLTCHFWNSALIREDITFACGWIRLGLVSPLSPDTTYNFTSPICFMHHSLAETGSEVNVGTTVADGRRPLRSARTSPGEVVLLVCFSLPPARTVLLLAGAPLLFVRDRQGSSSGEPPRIIP